MLPIVQFRHLGHVGGTRIRQEAPLDQLDSGRDVKLVCNDVSDDDFTLARV